MLAACCLYLDVNWITVALIHKLWYFSKCEGIPDQNFLHYWLCIQAKSRCRKISMNKLLPKYVSVPRGWENRQKQDGRPKEEAPRIEERWRFLSTQLPEGPGLATRNLETCVCISHDDRTSVHVYILLVNKEHCVSREVHSSLTGAALQSPKHNHTLQYRADSPYLEMQTSSTF